MIVIVFPISKIILSKKYYKDVYNGSTVKILDKKNNICFEFVVKCVGSNGEEIIYLVEESDISHRR